MEDINNYRLTKIEKDLEELKKEVTPLIQSRKIWNEWVKIILAAMVGASAREIFSYVSKHIHITLN